MCTRRALGAGLPLSAWFTAPVPSTSCIAILKKRLAAVADARRSLVGFVILTPIAFTWFLVYSAGYDRVFSEEFVRKIDASRLNLKDIGWTF